MIHPNYQVPEPTPEDLEVAREMIAGGYVQKSRKYCQLSRVPGGLTATEWLRTNKPDEYADALRNAVQQLEADCRGRVWCYREEVVTLTPGAFYAWRAMNPNQWPTTCNEILP